MSKKKLWITIPMWMLVLAAAAGGLVLYLVLKALLWQQHGIKTEPTNVNRVIGHTNKGYTLPLMIPVGGNVVRIWGVTYEGTDDPRPSGAPDPSWCKVVSAGPGGSTEILPPDTLEPLRSVPPDVLYPIGRIEGYRPETRLTCQGGNMDTFFVTGDG